MANKKQNFEKAKIEKPARIGKPLFNGFWTENAGSDEAAAGVVVWLLGTFVLSIFFVTFISEGHLTASSLWLSAGILILVGEFIFICIHKKYRKPFNIGWVAYTFKTKAEAFLWAIPGTSLFLGLIGWLTLWLTGFSNPETRDLTLTVISWALMIIGAVTLWFTINRVLAQVIGGEE
jgi:hypothetical protein